MSKKIVRVAQGSLVPTQQVEPRCLILFSLLQLAHWYSLISCHFLRYPLISHFLISSDLDSLIWYRGWLCLILFCWLQLADVNWCPLIVSDIPSYPLIFLSLMCHYILISKDFLVSPDTRAYPGIPWHQRISWYRLTSSDILFYLPTTVPPLSLFPHSTWWNKTFLQN